MDPRASRAGLSDHDGEFTWLGKQYPVKTLAAIMNITGVRWIDYLKVDCEKCEFLSIPEFIKESLQRFGRVPVTQLHIEVHSPGRNRGVTREWSVEGIGKAVPYASDGKNEASKSLLGLLERHGFVPFHIDFPRDNNQCCNVEYSLVNTRAPEEMLSAWF